MGDRRRLHVGDQLRLPDGEHVVARRRGPVRLLRDAGRPAVVLA